MMLVQSQAYRAQYGFNSIFLLPLISMGQKIVLTLTVLMLFQP